MRFIAGLPKAELHVHHVGSARPETVAALAVRHPDVGVPQDLAAQRTSSPSPILRTSSMSTFTVPAAHTEDIHLLTRRGHRRPCGTSGSLRRAHHDAVHQRADGHTDRGLHGAIEDARITAERDTGTVVRWIYRHPGRSRFCVGRRHDFVCRGPRSPLLWSASVWAGPGTGAGDRSSGATSTGPAAGLHAVPHSGESTGPETIWDAIRELGAERIGHGIAAIRDPRLVEYLAEHRIPPRSRRRRTRDAGRRADRGPPIRACATPASSSPVNSDDPPMFGTTLQSGVRDCRRPARPRRGRPAGVGDTALDVSFAPDDVRRGSGARSGPRMKLCPMTRADVPAFAPVFREIVDAGETYAIRKTCPTTRSPTCGWRGAPGARSWRSTTTAHLPRRSEDGAESARRGAHIGTASFMASSAARGQGRRAGTGQDMIDWHRRQGYGDPVQRRRQTNMAAVRLWVGPGLPDPGDTVPRRRSATHGPVGPTVMFSTSLPTARADGDVSPPPTGGSHVPSSWRSFLFPTRADLWRGSTSMPPTTRRVGPAGQVPAALPRRSPFTTCSRPASPTAGARAPGAPTMTALYLQKFTPRRTRRNDLAAQCLDRRLTGGKRPHDARRTRCTGPPGSPGRGQDLRRWRMTPAGGKTRSPAVEPEPPGHAAPSPLGHSPRRGPGPIRPRPGG